MRILILGCDFLGVRLASYLAQENHKITVIDVDGERLNALPENPNLQVFQASESLMFDLRRVGIANVDVFYAISDDDTRNAMAAQVATHIFRVSKVICRIDDPDRERFYKSIGINALCPTIVVVDTMKSALKSMAS